MPLSPVILGVVLLLGILGSQVVSNVPAAAMYLPILTQGSVSAVQYMALAAGCTIAGNLTIFGAPSNVIIVQHAGSVCRISILSSAGCR